MAAPLCLECARPILPGEAQATVQQVDACTFAVEHVPYHATCWEHKTRGAPTEDTGAR